MKLKLFSWNVRVANNPDKRNIIRNFIRSQRVDLVCLQETKIQEMFAADLMLEVLGWVDWLSGRLWRQRELQGVFLCFGIKEN